MKTTKIITVALLTTLVAGCTKDTVSNGHLRLLTESFDRNGSKVAFDPTVRPVGSQWVTGEPIMFNTTMFYVGQSGDDYYLITDATEAESFYVAEDGITGTAIYPGQEYDGNILTVSGNEMTLTNLVIEYDGSEQKMAFPMVAGSVVDPEESGDSRRLFFRHLTGGLKVTLANNDEENDVEIASLRIVAWSTDAATNHNYGGVTVRWENETSTPTVPAGATGAISENLNVSYASEMNFTFRDGNKNHVNVYEGDPITFCVPVTIDHVRFLTVTGYDAEGTEVFSKNADLGSSVSVQRNHMYTVGTINMN
jgi:hypothetical protein